MFVGGAQQGSHFIGNNTSQRKSYASVNNGPVKVVSNTNIVAAERFIYKANNVNTGYSEMMGLPNSLLDTTYWLPWYNNASPLTTELILAVGGVTGSGGEGFSGMSSQSGAVSEEDSMFELDSTFDTLDTVIDPLEVTVEDGSPFWQGLTIGASQDSLVTFTNIHTPVGEQHSNGIWGEGSVQVLYDTPNQRIQVWTYSAETGWTQRGEDISVPFADGDTFRARALADGTVEIYQNDTLLVRQGTTSSKAPKQHWFARFASYELAAPVHQVEPTETPTATATATQTPTPTQTAVPSGPVTIDYVYDPLNRLTSASYSDGRSFGYEYDAVGNVLEYAQTLSSSTLITTYGYNHANQLTTAQMENSPILWQYVHDPAGRLTEILPNGNPVNGAKRYTYNTAGYLVKAEAHDGNQYQLQAEMLYDGLGQRLSMTGYALGASVTTQYLLDPTQNSRPLAATSGGNTTHYLYGIDPIAEFTTSWSYSLPDGTNTPRQLTNAAGEITLAGSYTPWGNSLEYTGTGNFTFGYFGGLMDATTGLLYVGNGQYYDPATGRFFTRDAQPGKPNPYVPWGNPASALLAPLALVGLIYSKKQKKSRLDHFIIIAFVTIGFGMGLAACGPSTPTPPEPPTLPPPIVTVIHPPTETQPPATTSTPSGKTAYLTFDDGPDSSLTPQIALELQKRNMQATFFLTGADADSTWERLSLVCDPSIVPLEWANVEVVRLLQASGHAIGIHGWYHGDPLSHPEYYWTSQFFNVETYITKEVNRLRELGIKPDPLLRAPGGFFPSAVISGYEGWFYYGWTIDSGDDYGVPPQQIIDNVVQQLESKNIPDNPVILLHSIRPGTFEAIMNPNYDLLSKLENLGYTQFRKLPRPNDNPGYPPIWS